MAVNGIDRDGLRGELCSVQCLVSYWRGHILFMGLEKKRYNTHRNTWMSIKWDMTRLFDEKTKCNSKLLILIWRSTICLFQNISSQITLSKPIDFKNSKLCQSTAKKADECDEVFSYVPLVLIFLSQFVLGIGNTLYYSLGQSYLDDNTKQRNTPLMLETWFSFCP